MITQSTVYIVDDDDAVRKGLTLQLESAGFNAKSFSNGKAFLNADINPDSIACLILDVRMPEMSGLELQTEMALQHLDFPIIFLSGYGEVPVVVKTIQAGAIDFLTKPVKSERLLESVQKALYKSAENQKQNAFTRTLRTRMNKLTIRELEVLELVLKGYQNKEIARSLNISARTVEHHRSHILLKTGVQKFQELSPLMPHTTKPKQASDVESL